MILPHLTKLFKKLFCIPATSVTSERLFSLANSIIIKNLSPSNICILTFLKTNFAYMPKITTVHQLQHFDDDIQQDDGMESE